MKLFKIGKKNIGGKEPFFIAEAGINHNGSLKLALKRSQAISTSLIKYII